jgi:hypothetical protein
MSVNGLTVALLVAEQIAAALESLGPAPRQRDR